MRKFLKKITSPFLQWWFKKYYSKPRLFSYQNIVVTISPGVFPPQHTLSTKILLKHLETLELKGKTFLELGCGSGIISLLASKNGAYVTATDINKTALDQLEKSASNNGLMLQVRESDLLENITEPNFDYIFINPPYYPQEPKSIEEHAWFCGENFEYFEKLFNQLQHRLTKNSNCFIILSDDCNIEKIKNIALNNHMGLNLIDTKNSFWEINYIFRVLQK